MKITARIFTFVALAALAFGCTKEPDKPGRVTGSVIRNGKGIAMALVQAYPKADQDRTTPPVAEAPSNADGSFALDVPPGKYWVWAKATVEESGREMRLVGEATPNPVEPGSGKEVAVRIELADPSGFSRSTGPEGTGVSGRVNLGDKDANQAIIYVYPAAEGTPIGPGFSAAVDPAADGAFKINLAPGEYTLAVRQRKSGKDYGPPDKNDLVATARVSVASGSYVDLKELTLAPIDPVKWKSVTASLGNSSTSIGGVVADANGKPVEGIRVLAFRDSRMTGKPAFVSPPTGKDGKFLVQLAPEGGAFFLGARSRIGGPASPGEKVGQERGPKGGGIVVKSGEAKTGVNIQVEEVW